jgi:hypothetical protein
MKANPNGETMIGVLKQIRDEVTKTRQHHDNQAKPHRVLFYVTVFVAILAGVTFYFEIIRYSDVNIFKERIAEARGGYTKTLVAKGEAGD